MAALSLVGAAGTLWHRELTRFFRQPSRIAGAVGTPLIVWLLVGSGLSGSFRLPGAAAGRRASATSSTSSPAPWRWSSSSPPSSRTSR